MQTDDLREQLVRRGLDTEGDMDELAVHPGDDTAKKQAGHWWSWAGKVDDSADKSESCSDEPVECPNVEAGCKESVVSNDAEEHASETDSPQSSCRHCNALITARDLPEHEGSCSEEQIECPNVGCGVTVVRGSMAEHREVCNLEQVECPCPGCEERMARAEVEGHVAASVAVHLRLAWKRVSEMEDEIKELRKRSEALTRVFTWSTDSAWSVRQSLPYTFTDGVSGFALNNNKNNEQFVGFFLKEGPACTMHFKCSILDKNDKILRVVSDPSRSDLAKPPFRTAPVGKARGAPFKLTEEDKAGAVRADGSIKLRMVVHLYLPE